VAIAFGPVPSRRLGQSLGINNVPRKWCSYSCAYCQVGRKPIRHATPQSFYPAERILEAVSAKLEALAGRGERVDYLAFVPDGEPTLDVGLGSAIDALKTCGLPIAVISNASLVGLAEVRAALGRADWVSLKLDSVQPESWRRIHRPHAALELESVLEGMLLFAAQYRGFLVTDTMLLGGLNDSESEVEATASFIAELAPARAYLGVPTRPPAEPSARAPHPDVVARAHRQIARRVPVVECLAERPVGHFGPTGELDQELLGITAVHPLRHDEVAELVAHAGPDRAAKSWRTVERLVAEGRIEVVPYRGERFYVRGER